MRGFGRRTSWDWEGELYVSVCSNAEKSIIKHCVAVRDSCFPPSVSFLFFSFRWVGQGRLSDTKVLLRRRQLMLRIMVLMPLAESLATCMYHVLFPIQNPLVGDNFSSQVTPLMQVMNDTYSRHHHRQLLERESMLTRHRLYKTQIKAGVQ